MCLFLFLDFLPQLLFNDRPLTVLVSAQPIFKNPRKLERLRGYLLVCPIGKKLSVDGVMIDGTNYGALRQVLEALGFEVGWNGKDVVVKGKN